MKMAFFPRLPFAVATALCVTMLACGSSDAGSSSAPLNTAGAPGGGVSSTGGVSSAAGGSPSAGGFPNAAGGSPSVGGFPTAAGGASTSTGGVAGGSGGTGPIGAGGMLGSGGMQTAACTNVACFDVYDCTFLASPACGFTQCAAGICK